MNIVLLFMFSILIILGSFSLVMFLAFRHQLSNSVTFAEMEKCEHEIKEKYFDYVTQYRRTYEDGSLDTVDIDALTQKLCLKIEEASLPSSVRGVLEASDCPEYNGVICFATDEGKPYSKNFDIMHEIVHYLKDVGVGNRVSKSFARTHHGNPRSHREQVVDYYAAAMAIPKESLKKQISLYSGDPYSEEFIIKMTNVYGQPYETVQRRINEVIALS